ncbi:MAG TPA: tryptophan--tRNA ligase, partial [Verrucomicrobiae bacterium]|nr:tryptophan--tRNA ligase [Verrucomicrobiae bacterium]
LDPQKSVIFLQSQVPEHAELHLLLSMITPLGELERIPTYKEALENITDKDLHTYGFLGYPTLQTADIVMYSVPGKPLIVPVGEDQVAHVEFSRQIVSRFNFFYGLSLDYSIFDPKNETHLRKLYDRASDALIEKESWKGRSFVDHFVSVLNKVALENAIRRIAQKAGVKNFQDVLGPEGKFFAFVEVLTEPQSLLTPTPRVPGLDGRKMSKSYGNAITLSESDADIRSKTKVMVTDPARKRRTDPGNPDICPVYDWHKLFSTPERDPGRLDWVRNGCTTAGIGCIECKSAMADNLIKWITPIRERRLDYEQHPKRVLEILDQGSEKARESAKRTMQRVRESIFNWQSKRQELASR